MKKNGKLSSEMGQDAFNADEWKTFDIKKAVEQDIRASLSLLHLILDNPQILDLVIAEIEKLRAKMVEQESLPKREDFHPELANEPVNLG